MTELKLGDYVTRISNPHSGYPLPIGSTWVVRRILASGLFQVHDDPGGFSQTRDLDNFVIVTKLTSREELEALYD